MRNRTTREIIIMVEVWKCGSVRVCECASVQKCADFDADLHEAITIVGPTAR